MSEDCHDCFEPGGGSGSGGSGSGGSGSGGSGGGRGGGDDTPRPPRGPNGEELPPWPAWLENPLVIGVDRFSGRAVAVGLFMNNEHYTEETTPSNALHLKGKRIPHSNDGLAMAAVVTSDDRWVSTHLAKAEEIAAYDCLVFIALKLEWTDLSEHPPYALDAIPPFPYWFQDGIIVFDGPDTESPNMHARVAVGRNGRDGYMWVIKSLDSHEWFSYRYAQPEDLVRYDDAFLAANRVVGSFPRLLQKVNPPPGYEYDV